MRLSVIIPTLNEEKNIKACLESIKKINPFEIIVADGGSTDRTKEIAKENGATFIETKRGRGIQMNRGASLAGGDVLLFLHADSRLLMRDKEKILTCLDNTIAGNYIGGFFRLKFDNGSLSTRLVELFANMRARIFSLPYGDQAIFIERAVFKAIGGFKEYPFLEDLDLVLRIKRSGYKLRYIDIPVIASSRRIKKWYPLSPIVVSLRNVLIALLFIFGINPSSLLRLYK